MNSCQGGIGMEEKMYEGVLPNGVSFRYMYLDGIWGFALDWQNYAIFALRGINR